MNGREYTQAVLDAEESAEAEFENVRCFLRDGENSWALDAMRRAYSFSEKAQKLRVSMKYRSLPMIVAREMKAKSLDLPKPKPKPTPNPYDLDDQKFRSDLTAAREAAARLQHEGILR